MNENSFKIQENSMKNVNFEMDSNNTYTQPKDPVILFIFIFF